MTAWVSQQSPFDILTWSAKQDIALPLPYLLYWAGGLFFGHSEVGLRLLSILFVALTLTVLFRAFQDKSRKGAWLVCTLALLPTVHWMSGEVRYYAVLVLASMLSHYASKRLISNEGISLLGVVTAWILPPLMHPLGVVVTVLNMLVTATYLARQGRLRPCLTGMVYTALALSALLLPFVIDDLNRQTYWPGTVDIPVVFREMAGFLVSGRYMGDPWLPVVIIVAVSLLALLKFRSPIIVLALITLWAGWGILLLIITLKPVFQVRYGLPLLASWLIVFFAPIGAVSPGSNRPVIGGLTFLLAFVGMFWFGGIADDYPDRRIKLREAATWIEERAGPNDIVVGWPPDITKAVSYYLPNLHVENWGPDGIWSLDNMANFDQTWEQMPASEKRVWLLNITYYSDHDPAQTLQTALELRGAITIESTSFDLVSVSQIQLPDRQPDVKTFVLNSTLPGGPRLEKVSLLNDVWCLNQPNPVYLYWRRMSHHEPSFHLRVSVRLTRAQGDLTPLVQHDGSPVPQYNKVTYFPAWWPENEQEVGRFVLYPEITGAQWLTVVAYLEDNGAFTVLHHWPIAPISLQSCQ